MRVRTALLILIPVALVAAFAVGWWQRDALIALVDPGDPSGGEASGPSGRPPPGVEVVAAQEQPVQQRISSTGTLIAPESVTVTAEAAGRITEIAFEEGEAVDAGEVLAELDSARAEASVDQAEARLVQRRRDAERKRELEGENFVAQGELELALAAAEEAESALAIAREELDDRTLRAPFAGVTGRRLVSPGALVEPGTPVTELVRVDPLDLLLDVPGTELGSIERGIRVRATSPAYPDRAFIGHVSFVGTSVDPETRTLPLEATLDNSEGLLKPGMFMRAEILLDAYPAVRVPEEAIIARGPMQVVFVVGPGQRVERRSVETGVRRGGLVEIVAGVAPGEPVVTAGHALLRDGMRVRVGGSGGERPNSGGPPAAGAESGNGSEGPR